MCALLKKGGTMRPSLVSQIKADREKFTILWASDMTALKIAKKIGCSQAHVSRIAMSLGLPQRKKSKKDILAIAKVHIMYGIYHGDGFKRNYADRLFNFPSVRRRIYYVFYLRMKRLYDSDLIEFSRKFWKANEESQKESSRNFLLKKECNRRLKNQRKGEKDVVLQNDL
jgi:hypothetical protein